MRKKKTLLAGIISGLLCALAVFMFMQKVQEDAEGNRVEMLARYGGEQIEVCVAERSITLGEKIDSSNVTTKLWLADLLPEGAIRSFADISGKTATSTILPGEVISSYRFERTDSSFDIPDGLSALSVPAKDVHAVGGVLSGGMRIDLYATGTSTSVLARNVLVLSTSIETEDKKAGSSISWVTLALEPQAVQEVIAASQKMELYFVLPGTQSEETS